MTLNTEAELAVTQDDRNAAVRLLEAGGQDWQAKEIRVGNGDHFLIVRAFAAHRLASQRAPSREVVEAFSKRAGTVIETGPGRSATEPPRFICWFETADDAYAFDAALRVPLATLSAQQPQPDAEAVELLRQLCDAVEALPVDDWVEQESDGSPTLIGYVMQAQGEWDQTRRAKEAAQAYLSCAKGGE